MPAPKLTTYRAKRDFSKTREPAGGAVVGDGGNRFVVHKHHATADHYDLRLQVGDVLKSWAVPKGPSLNPADKRLAVETEDHPLEYIDFEGVIPEGEYGGGPMIVWDTGVWAPMDDVEKSLATGAFKFRLAGEKLNGGWMLARLKPKPGDDGKKQLAAVQGARPRGRRDAIDILAARPESVKSGRRIEELVEKPKAAAPSRSTLKPGALPGAVQAPCAAAHRAAARHADARPARRRRTGCTRSSSTATAPWRMSSHGAVRLITRSGLDWTKRYGDLPDAFAALPCTRGDHRRRDRGARRQGHQPLRAAAGRAVAKAPATSWSSTPSTCSISTAGILPKAPLDKRKALLRATACRQRRRPLGASSSATMSRATAARSTTGRPRWGSKASSRSAPRRPIRAAARKTWTKTKALQVGDFVIAGYTISRGGRGARRAGARRMGRTASCTIAARSAPASTPRTLRELLARLEPLRAGATPLDGAPKDMIWVRPVLSARIHYANRTTDNALRHAVFKGLRDVELSTPVAPSASG